MRPGMDKLIAKYHRAGIQTIMITGDQAATAQAIGEQLGLSGDQPLQVLESTKLDEMDPDLLAGLAKNVHVFARVSPAHKLKIVRALQEAGYVVAMTGDGINDGPALKAADIGVAMGLTGTNVAREVSDVVLEDDNLHTMSVAVRQGRTNAETLALCAGMDYRCRETMARLHELNAGAAYLVKGQAASATNPEVLAITTSTRVIKITGASSNVEFGQIVGGAARNGELGHAFLMTPTGR